MNASLVGRLSRDISRFEAGELGVADLQGRLESTLAALDRSFPDLVSDLESAASDLEEIRFTVLEDEQRSAVLHRMSTTKSVINSVLQRLG